MNTIPTGLQGKDRAIAQSLIDNKFTLFQGDNQTLSITSRTHCKDKDWVITLIPFQQSIAIQHKHLFFIKTIAWNEVTIQEQISDTKKIIESILKDWESTQPTQPKLF